MPFTKGNSGYPNREGSYVTTLSGFYQIKLWLPF